VILGKNATMKHLIIGSEGLENDNFQPELKTPFHEGDFEIDYAVIYEGDRDNIGKELMRDTDYDD